MVVVKQQRVSWFHHWFQVSVGVDVEETLPASPDTLRTRPAAWKHPHISFFYLLSHLKLCQMGRGQRKLPQSCLNACYLSYSTSLSFSLSFSCSHFFLILSGSSLSDQASARSLSLSHSSRSGAHNHICCAICATLDCKTGRKMRHPAARPSH